MQIVCAYVCVCVCVCVCVWEWYHFAVSHILPAEGDFTVASPDSCVHIPQPMKDLAKVRKLLGNHSNHGQLCVCVYTYHVSRFIDELEASLLIMFGGWYL